MIFFFNIFNIWFEVYVSLEMVFVILFINLFYRRLDWWVEDVKFLGGGLFFWELEICILLIRENDILCWLFFEGGK